jgi:hypothetical protein
MQSHKRGGTAAQAFGREEDRSIKPLSLVNYKKNPASKSVIKWPAGVRACTAIIIPGRPKLTKLALHWMRGRKQMFVSSGIKQAN